MGIITIRDLLDQVILRWHDAYYEPGRGWKPGGVDKENIYNRLIALTPRTKENVNAIIGNKSWTRLECDACHQEVEIVCCIDVTRGEYVTYICANCLRKMLAVVELRAREAE